MIEACKIELLLGWKSYILGGLVEVLNVVGQWEDFVVGLLFMVYVQRVSIFRLEV